MGGSSSSSRSQTSSSTSSQSANANVAPVYQGSTINVTNPDNTAVLAQIVAQSSAIEGGAAALSEHVIDATNANAQNTLIHSVDAIRTSEQSALDFATGATNNSFDVVDKALALVGGGIGLSNEAVASLTSANAGTQNPNNTATDSTIKTVAIIAAIAVVASIFIKKG